MSKQNQNKNLKRNLENLQSNYIKQSGHITKEEVKATKKNLSQHTNEKKLMSTLPNTEIHSDDDDDETSLKKRKITTPIEEKVIECFGVCSKKGKNFGRMWTCFKYVLSKKIVPTTFKFLEDQVKDYGKLYRGVIKSEGENQGKSYSVYKMKNGDFISGTFKFDKEEEINAEEEELREMNDDERFMLK